MQGKAPVLPAHADLADLHAPGNGGGQQKIGVKLLVADLDLPEGSAILQRKEIRVILRSPQAQVKTRMGKKDT